MLQKDILEVSIDYIRSRKYAYRDRKNRKRDFRKLWITRINAACRMNDISYSKFINGLNKAGVEVNRKMLSEIAINDMDAFKALVEISKKGLEGKVSATDKKVDTEVTIGGKKTAAKKETKPTTKKETKSTPKKEEKTEEVDYSKMTVAELKEIAKKKKISVTGLKKAEIIKKLK